MEMRSLAPCEEEKMIRSNMKALLLAGVALGVAGSAVAADDQKLEKPFRLSVGAFFPSDREIRDITDNVHFAFGLSYDFWRRKSGQAGNDWAAALYFDGTPRRSTSTGRSATRTTTVSRTSASA